MSNLQPAGCMWSRMAVNGAQHKIVNLLKTFLLLIGFSVCVLNVWPKTTLFPVWPRDTEGQDTPGGSQRGVMFQRSLRRPAENEVERGWGPRRPVWEAVQ